MDRKFPTTIITIARRKYRVMDCPEKMLETETGQPRGAANPRGERRAEMKFLVGPWTYTVRLVPNLKNMDGAPACGLCDGVKRVISIDTDVPDQERVSVLFHELRHCWQFEFGRPQNAEDDANQAASFAVDVWRQLMAQGGEAALLLLQIDHQRKAAKRVKAA